MDYESRAYLTIVRWPEGYGEAEKIRALTEIASQDTAVARQNARHAVPRIVQRLESSVATIAVARLTEQGIAALAPSHAQIALALHPPRAKRIAPASNSPDFMVEYWREAPSRFGPDRIFLLVRAHVKVTAMRTEVEAQVATGLQGAETVWQPASRRSLSIVETLDIHRHDAPTIRITADKFSFDALGPKPGFTDLEKLERFTTLLASMAPHVVIDREFLAFHPGIGFSTGKSGPGGVAAGSGISWDGTRLDPGTPATFEFYSAWRGIVVRFLKESR